MFFLTNQSFSLISVTNFLLFILKMLQRPTVLLSNALRHAGTAFKLVTRHHHFSRTFFYLLWNDYRAASLGPHLISY
jgi:hypothetical protein